MSFTDSQFFRDDNHGQSSHTFLILNSEEPRSRVDLEGTTGGILPAAILVACKIMTQPLASTPRVQRLDSLTGLRWWAAFGVFAYHMTNLAPLPLVRVLSFGNFGVMFFFILSGFVLTWSANPSVTPQTFWWRRVARIYPAHFVALLLAIPVFYSFTPAAEQSWVKPVSVGILLLSVVLLQGWWRDPVILFSGNPAAWTLTCEAFFYALHPLMNRALRVLRMRTTFFVSLAIVGVAFAYRGALFIWPETFVGELPWPVVRLTEFALGMCAAHAMRLGWRPRLKPIVMYAIGGVFIGWVLYGDRLLDTGAVGAVIRATTNELLIVLCVLLIVSVASRDLLGGRSLLRSKLLVVLGEWSYAFYLMHATVMYAVISVVGRQPMGWINLVWYAGMLVLALAAAAALHYWVERPCEKAMRSFWDRRLEHRKAASLLASVEGP